MKRIAEIHLGAWTIFCDIAGWVQENPDNPIVTIAAVAMPPETVKKRRAQVLEAFAHAPVKWKAGGVEGWNRILPITTKRDVHVAISQVHRAGTPWGQFYDQAKAFLDDAEPRLKGRPVYLTADNIMRILLLSKGFAGLIGRVVRARYPWGSRPARLHMDIVADSELKGPEAEKVWREAIEEWPSRSRLSVELGFGRRHERGSRQRSASRSCCFQTTSPVSITMRIHGRVSLVQLLPQSRPLRWFKASARAWGDGSMSYHVATLFGTGGISLGMRPPGR